MILTDKLIVEGASDRGGWNREQLAIFGISWPPKKGWKQNLIGREISDEMYAKFIQSRKMHKTGPMMMDSNVESVREKLKKRAEIGLKKYGVTTERDDLSTLEWLHHAQQEAMDFCVYLERLITECELKPPIPAAVALDFARSTSPPPPTT